MTLHTIANNTIDVDMIRSNDAVLFWQNGVILALSDNAILNKIIEKTQNCYILDNDIIARGLTHLIDSQVKIIDIKQVINLTVQYYPQMAW